MNHKSRTKISILLFAIVFLAASCNLPGSGPYNEAVVEIGTRRIDAEVAETDAAKARGLSGRKSIGQSEGMLFPYEGEFVPGFWMKDMNFPIDILWIKDGTIVDIDIEVKPETFDFDSQYTVYKPSTAIDAVLEVKAGSAERWNIKIGDKAKIQIK